MQPQHQVENRCYFTAKIRNGSQGTTLSARSIRTESETKQKEGKSHVDFALYVRVRGRRLSERRGDHDAAGEAADPSRLAFSIGVTDT